jgi:tRNA 2-selenouridine synthase
MTIQKITIQQFLQLATQHAVLDVRSPGEYTHAHIPNAINLPLFTNEERKIVGTAYKQQSRQVAIKLGLDFFGIKMKAMVEEVEKMLDVRSKMYESPLRKDPDVHPTSNIVLVHCWRGGMRSAAVAWLLDMYGFTVYTLIGGYKAYRHWVLQQFTLQYSFTIIGGYTGSGKTQVLHQLKKENKNVIDLEALANHKGSAFGTMGNQPTQEMFENLLAERLVVDSWSLTEDTTNHQSSTINQPSTTNFFIEDESQRIGNIKIPNTIWQQMRNTTVLFLDIPFDQRLEYITIEYGKLTKETLVNAIIRIQKRLGGLETKNAINHLLENNPIESFRILLTYYDKWYLKGLHTRENLSSFLNKIPCNSVDSTINTKNILACCTTNA